MPRSEAVVDVAILRRNTAALKARTNAEVMAVVKADGYGHGLVATARAALAGGASWLGVAVLEEALQLRAAGIRVPVMSWLWTPSEIESVRRAVSAGIDIGVGTLRGLQVVAEVSEQLQATARVHLKLDTGLSRNGTEPQQWGALLQAAIEYAEAEQIDIVGIWSHFAYADNPGHPTIDHQLEVFEWGLAVAADEGIRPRYRHIANSAALLTRPDAHYDMVRPGIALYGLPPVPGDFGLVPAMTLRAELASVKRVPAGSGVSYGHDYVTDHATTLALVPLGYADGIPRNASNIAPVQFGSSRFSIAGRVCMDQFVLDVGAVHAEIGDIVTLFGSGVNGEPTAREWADILETIDYEIVTRIGPRVRRTYVDSDVHADDTDDFAIEGA